MNCVKKRFLTRRAAEIGIERSTFTREKKGEKPQRLSAYICQFCNCFHITSRPQGQPTPPRR